MDRRRYLATTVLILVAGALALGGLFTTAQLLATQRAINEACTDAERRMGTDCCRATDGRVLCRLEPRQ